MKHKSIILLCALAVAGALVLAVNSNNTYLQTAKAHAAAVDKQVQQNIATNKQLQSQVTTLKVENSNLEAQCAVGLKDYGLLTSTQKLQNAAPVCAVQSDTATVQ